MKIGILQPAGIAAEIVYKAFSLQEMQELYKPVIYSKENQNDKNVLADLREGNIDAITVAPGSSFAIPGSTIMAVTPQLRVVSAFTGADLQTVYKSITKEAIKEELKLLSYTLQRDFGNTNPRVALLALNAAPDTQEKEILEPVVHESLMEHLSVHGPYLLETFISEEKYANFDAVLAITDTQRDTLLKAVSDNIPANLILGMPYVITTCPGKLPETAEDIEPEIELMRRAYYLALDLTRNRKVFDKASAHPLPKLYHEHREDGDKARFAVKRPPFMKPTKDSTEVNYNAENKENSN